MTLVKFKNNILKKIINVYQPNYKNMVAQGFGDYLRGCFCIFQICKMYGLEFDMDLSNHPMSEFLIISNKDKYQHLDRQNISWYPNPNYKPTSPSKFIKDSLYFHNQFVTHLNNIKDSEYFLFCNSFPVFNQVQDIARNTIYDKILPNPDLKMEVDHTLVKLGLSKKNFSVIHIRTGDNYLLNNHSPDFNLIKKIMRITSPFLHLKEKKYLILSDCNKIKYLFRKYSNCIFTDSCITHLGENGDKDIEKIKSTLVDFFIMGNANYIISLSPYNWGSGFSHWCSVLHKIPYRNILL